MLLVVQFSGTGDDLTAPSDFETCKKPWYGSHSSGVIHAFYPEHSWLARENFGWNCFFFLMADDEYMC
jgi:hypothetical protein